MAKMNCFSKEGLPIPYDQMLKLVTSEHYRRVKKDKKLIMRVSTNWFGHAIYYRGTPYIFKTEVYCLKCPFKQNVIDGDIYATMQDALAGHERYKEQYLTIKYLIRHWWITHVLKKYEFKRPKTTKGRSKKVWASLAQ